METTHKKKRCRILVLVPDGMDGKGGIERLMLYLSRSFGDTAPDIEVIAHPTRLVSRKPWNHFSTPISLIWFWLRLVFMRPDMVHANVAPRGSTWRKGLFIRVAHALDVPVLIHLHGSGYDAFFDAQSPARRARIHKMFTMAQTVVVLGDYWKQFAKKTLRVSPDRIAVINNGAPDTASRATPSTMTCNIAFAGLIGERKGVDVLLRAVSLLPKDNTWHVTLGGNGEIERFQKMADDLGLTDQVHFVGWLGEEDMDNLLTEAQIFVLPSRAENQPVAILEAMARGLPVISTRIGAIPEQVIDGLTGLVVAPDDVQALREAIADLIASPQKRADMGKAARAHFEAHYALETGAAAFADLYRGKVSEPA